MFTQQISKNRYKAIAGNLIALGRTASEAQERLACVLSTPKFSAPAGDVVLTPRYGRYTCPAGTNAIDSLYGNLIDSLTPHDPTK